MKWSPDGLRLAIACDWGVVIAQPWSEDAMTIPVPGGPNELVWLDDRRVAVGCDDTNLRIYTWKSEGGRQELLDVLEAHDAPIVDLSGPTETGEFASIDMTGRLCVWSPNLALRFALTPPLVPASEQPAMPSWPKVALHPRLALAVVDLKGIVSRVDLTRFAIAVEARVEDEFAAPAIAGVLVRAKLTRRFPIHSDGVADCWALAPPWGQYDKIASHIRTCKQIAAVTCSLVLQGGDALRLLWKTPEISVRVQLEKMAFIPSQSAADNHVELRERLLALLGTEIKNGNLPQYRWAAAAAYLAVGHLGRREAEAAFRPTAGLDELLPFFDEQLRMCVHDAGHLFGDKLDPASLLERLSAASAQVGRALSEARWHLGSRLTSMTAHTVILKGGGAKGIAHVGALEEIRRYYNCERFAGTSAGAIVAVLLGAGLTNEELKEELVNTDFSKLIHEPWWRCCLNFVTKFGLYSGRELVKWLDNALARKRNMHTRVRLKNLPLHTKIYACQGHEPAVIFDSQAPESMNEFAAYAARCSMSIPFYFVPEFKGGLHFFDPGWKLNYPVEALLKDHPDAEFIGLYLGIPILEGVKAGVPSAVFANLFEANDTTQLEKHKDRTVIIDTRPIGTLKFKLSEEEKRFLFLAGQVAALTFLHNRGVDLSDRADFNPLSAELDSLREKLNMRRARRRLMVRRCFAIASMGAVGVWTLMHWRLWEWPLQ